MNPAIITILILVAAVVLFLTEWVPLKSTVLLVTISLVLFGIIDGKTAISGLANSNVVLICGMCVIGAALFNTGMAYKIGNLITYVAKSERQIVLGIMLICGALSAFLSNTGAVAVLIPIVMGVSAKSKIKPSKLMIPLMIAAGLGGSITLIGSPPNMIVNDALISFSDGAMKFGFFEYSKVGIPLLVGGILYILFAGLKLLPNRDSSNEFINKEVDYSRVPTWKQYLSLIILIVTVLGMVFEDAIGVPLYITSTFGAVVLVLTKVVTEKEAVQSFEVTAVFLVAFMLPLATALEKTGAGELIASTLLTYVGNGSSVVLTGTLWLIAAVLTQFMSNTATAALLAPIGTSIAATLGADPRAVLMAIFIGSSCAFMTPVAMPCSTMVLQPGGYKFKDYVKTGLPLFFICFVISMILLSIFYPFYP